MNIAVILPSLKNKAPIQVAKDIAHQLMVKGCTVDVYYFDNITEVEFNCNTQRISLMEEIDFIKYDVVHSHMLRADFYVWLHRKKTSAICVSTLHNEIDKVLKNDYNFLISKIFTKLWVMFLKSHDEVICLSKYAQNELSVNFNLQKANYIYNGRFVKEGLLAISDLKILTEKKKRYRLLGVIANVSKIKGIDQIIESLIHLQNYCLIVVGDGPERENLENKIEKLDLKDRCVFFGYRENAHVFLKYIDLYMMTSFSEGFPLVLIEAAQYRKPTVCSNIPLFREIFPDNEVVFFDLNNRNSLISAVNSAYSRKEDLSTKIHSKYRNSYSTDMMGTNYFERFKCMVETEQNIKNNNLGASRVCYEKRMLLSHKFRDITKR
jgi:glycosyltransferase involved in cell wall biosynthesis